MVTKVFERLLSKVLEIIPFLFFSIKDKHSLLQQVPEAAYVGGRQIFLFKRGGFSLL